MLTVFSLLSPAQPNNLLQTQTSSWERPDWHGLPSPLQSSEIPDTVISGFCLFVSFFPLGPMVPSLVSSIEEMANEALVN